MNPPARTVRKPLPTGAGAVLGAAAATGLGAVAAATLANVVTIHAGHTSALAIAGSGASGWDRHGPALPGLAVVGAVMLRGAVRGARPAAAALLACGAAVLAIALAADLPRLHDTGRIGEAYAEARAEPGAGFHLELAGGVLVLASAAGLLLVPRDRRERRSRDRRERRPRGRAQNEQRPHERPSS